MPQNPRQFTQGRAMSSRISKVIHKLFRLGRNDLLQTFQNQKVIFMPLEATSLIGSLGGIAELAKEAMGKQGDRNA